MKSKRVVKRKTRAAVKTKTVRKRVIRKPKAEASTIPIESAPAEPTLLESITKKPIRVVKRKTRAGVKAKAVRKRVIRKPRAKASPTPLAIEHPVSPIDAAPEPESDAILVEQAKASPSVKAEEPGEKPAKAEAGFRIPQVLLEGDEPFSVPMTGLGQKYALGPTAPASQFAPEPAALPEAYGTGRLLLAARDPHWLYAHWDLTHEQQRHYNALSANRHLVVRVYPGAIGARPVTEVHVHPESRHWFIHVDRADTRYVAELGYYQPRHQWVTVAVSPPAATPADSASADLTVRYATIPAHTRLTQLASLAKQAVPADLPPADAARERALAELVAQQLVLQDQAGSAEVPELVRGRGENENSPTTPSLPAPLGGEAENVSSPIAPAAQRPSGFWFSINAELVIYGATEPGARLTIGGRPIALRPDGTFSCRCSLPDGDHTVTVSAMSAEGELRQAKLAFTRRTDYRGAAAAAPRDLSLQPPGSEDPAP